MLPDFRQYYKATVSKTVCNWHKNRYTDQQNREPRNKLMYLWSINLQQRRQEYTRGKVNLFNKLCRENWTATYKRMKLQHFPYIVYKYLRPETMKLLAENTEHYVINRSKIFWICLLSKGNKSKINKWDLIKLKIFCRAKETNNKEKDNLLNGRKYLLMIWPIGVISKIYKHLIQCSI